MQANELRIGNIVNHKGVHMVITTNAILAIFNGDNNYSPIFLTTDIFEKCGFENLGLYGDGDNRISDCWVLPYLRPEENEARQRIIIVPHPSDKDTYTLGVDNEANNFKIAITWIKYLHEFQNAFRLFTKTEITIK